jgi:hypothetical protein
VYPISSLLVLIEFNSDIYKEMDGIIIITKLAHSAPVCVRCMHCMSLSSRYLIIKLLASISQLVINI